MKKKIYNKKYMCSFKKTTKTSTIIKKPRSKGTKYDFEGENFLNYFNRLLIFIFIFVLVLLYSIHIYTYCILM